MSFHKNRCERGRKHSKQEKNTKNEISEKNNRSKICTNRKNVLPLHPQTKGKQILNGALAQLVEHRTENPCVPGSIPGGTTPPFIMNPVKTSVGAGFFYCVSGGYKSFLLFLG